MFVQDRLPRSYEIGELNFDRKEPNYCMLVIGAVIFYVLFLKPQHPLPLCNPIAGTASMVSSVMRSVSARIAGTSDDADMSPEVADVVAVVPGKVKAFDSIKWREFTDEDKRAMFQRVLSHLSSHRTMVIMVYAPWCPHCSTMMPHIKQLAKEKKSKFSLINAETLTDDQLKHAVGKVEHFPCFFKKKGTVIEPKATPDEAAEDDGEPDEPPAAPDAPAVSAGIAVVEGGPFDNLF